MTQPTIEQRFAEIERMAAEMSRMISEAADYMIQAKDELQRLVITYEGGEQ